VWRVVKWLLMIVAAVAGAFEAWLWFSRPSLVRDLAGTLVFFRRAQDPESAFDQRVKSTFPIGLAEVELRANLERQGFRTYKDTRFVDFVTQEAPCATQWIVLWKANGTGAVTSVSGLVKSRCL